ncbi:phiSA1p31-related protein [Streptomyces sp. NBC_00239]|uniref:phiSA1p31-related protein n=1 Tax=Streptomyces sp. NBC_00239 TaxID=2903640 RepID=UPI002E27F8AE|nr:phiSA1p31-related protein [Streptomyces sp. NBC_00239]
MAFKVGDEVRFAGARGVVDQGAYESTGLRTTAYVVLMSDGPDEGRTLVAKASELTPAAFSNGDRVRDDSTEYTVEAGPFMGHSEWYAVKAEDGKVFSSAGVLLTLVEHATETVKVGDRVRVVKDDPCLRTGEFVGLVGTVESTTGAAGTPRYLVRFGSAGHGSRNGEWYCAEVEPVDEPQADTYEYNGVTYDLTARYRDADGDYWSFVRVGDTVRGMYSCFDRDASGAVDEHSTTLRDAVYRYGPLTRV